MFATNSEIANFIDPDADDMIESASTMIKQAIAYLNLRQP